MLGISMLFGQTSFCVFFLVINVVFVAAPLRLKKTATQQDKHQRVNVRERKV